MTWNLGPKIGGHCLEDIRQLLRQGPAILLVQELRFLANSRRGISQELAELDKNYGVFVETGCPNRCLSETTRLPGKHSTAGYGWAVATFLHRESFDIRRSKRRA